MNSWITGLINAVTTAGTNVVAAVAAANGIPSGATRIGWKVDEGDAATIYTVPADTLLTITHVSIAVGSVASDNGEASLSTTDEGEVLSTGFGATGGSNTLNLSGLSIQLAATKVLSWARVNSPIVRISIRGYTQAV